MPRHAASGAGVLLIAASVSAAAFVAGRTPSPTLGASTGRACGVERWRVKTLSDSMAGRVSLVPHATSVRALRRLRPPTSLPSNARVRPVETTTYRVHARLVESKLEEDSDFHLVIADPRTGGTMIVEFPAFYCTLTTKRVLRLRMQAARLAFIRACGLPPSSDFKRLRGTATITGVGFFDFQHGQSGVAPNAIELHPVLGFKGACS